MHNKLKYLKMEENKFMRVPHWLSHKPIVVAENLSKLDGPYTNATDLKGYSIGKAGFDSDEISAKVWRHTGEKWSRQGEELPIHRVLDLAQLYLGALLRNPESSFPETVFGEEIRDKEDFHLIKEHYHENEADLMPGILKIKELVDRIGLKYIKV